jgi:hypothetical protein
MPWGHLVYNSINIPAMRSGWESKVARSALSDTFESMACHQPAASPAVFSPPRNGLWQRRPCDMQRSGSPLLFATVRYLHERLTLEPLEE